jgi:hypothetical protein
MSQMGLCHGTWTCYEPFVKAPKKRKEPPLFVVGDVDEADSDGAQRCASAL